MYEFSTDPTPPPLSDEFLTRLRTLVAGMQAHTGEWGEWGGGEDVRLEDGRIAHQMPYSMPGPIPESAMEWLYESNRIFNFRWAEWDEGREIFRQWTDATPAMLDHLTVRQLLTAIARNDRFCEGAWMGMFEDGFAVPLFTRLLELEEHLAAGGSQP